ncbi:MAG TPA: glycosyltransferase family 4 protein [Methylomirabilota bacterium]|nr:glycosyltransferase family 4 protein [Methylomirabilota bacterium]
MWYFSYRPEALADYTSDAELLRGIDVVAPRRPLPRAVRAVQIPFAHAALVRRCGALRAFQITGVIPALVAQRRFGVPFVTTYGFWYGSLSEPGPKRLFKSALEHLALRRASAVIATTESLRARAARLAVRVELIPNGVDTRHFAPSRCGRTPRPGARRRLLCVGRLSTEKNLSTVIRAAALLERRMPVQLVIVGDGPQRAKLVAEAAAAAVPLELLGVVDQRALPPVYASADAFVLASFTEGHPKVLLEAMSVALPCVASDCDGNRSLIAPGQTGLLFDAHRPEELASLLESVLTQPDLAASLGRAARELVVTRYDLGALVDREIALIREVAGRRG